MSRCATQSWNDVLQATKQNIAIVCAWCPELHIMKLPRQPHDRIEILMEGTAADHSRRLVIRRNGEQMAISYGICRICSADERKRAKVLGHPEIGNAPGRGKT